MLYKVVLTFDLYKMAIHMKAIKQCFPVMPYIMLCKMNQSYLKCDDQFCGQSLNLLYEISQMKARYCLNAQSYSHKIMKNVSKSRKVTFTAGFHEQPLL